MLSEISQTEKDKYHMISLICGIENKQTNKPKLIETENRRVVARDGGAGVQAKWVKGVKRYKIPVMKCMSQHGDYS